MLCPTLIGLELHALHNLIQLIKCRMSSILFYESWKMKILKIFALRVLHAVVGLYAWFYMDSYVVQTSNGWPVGPTSPTP